MAAIPSEGVVIIARRPMTSASLFESIRQFCGADHLYFYDAISPIINAETIDQTKVYKASRYGNASDDYINCPMDRSQYDAFYEALILAESVAMHDFEEPRYFESCLPIEELARRGRDTLRFGPMRPVGLLDPSTGKMPHAVVQLRQEDLMHSSYNIVGFQNHLKFDEQRRIFRMIPGLENAEFLRLGQIHRNTYINAPKTLLPTMAARQDGRIFFAGQLAGTEGYIENVASGLIAGVNAVRHLRKEPPLELPAETAIGALCRYVSTPQKHFAPMNINFGLLPALIPAKKLSKTDKQRVLCERALTALSGLRSLDICFTRHESGYATIPLLREGGVDAP